MSQMKWTQTQKAVLPSWTPCTATIRNMAQKALDMGNLNPNIIKLQYAVRGPLVIRAGALKSKLAKGDKLPFKQIVLANLGDAQAMKQKPITFIRQVVSCLAYPKMLESDLFPPDVKKRAQDILKTASGNSVGSYSVSYGMELIRQHVAEHIECRDGFKSKWQDVCLTAGATSGIKHVLELFCNLVNGKPSGVMIPTPQYPLYSATLAEYGLGQIRYYLDEDKNWSLDLAELERAYAEGCKTHAVRAIVVINPGNPTGQVLKRANIEEIIKFAHKKNLFVLADEVYQSNVYDKDSKFFSFKKVMNEMGAPYNELELVSFMSISKGYIGECGFRGGWMELVNMDPKVHENLYKAISAGLCPATLGQAVVDCIAKTPVSGEPSYDLWIAEKTAVLKSLKDRAEMIVKAFNNMKGFKCNIVQGAMYAFPRIEIPPKAIEAAKAEGKAPDVFYAFQLLEQSGICVVPGSGFGQRPGTYHFRTTILPQPKELQEMLDMFQDFHKKFTEKYA